MSMEFSVKVVRAGVALGIAFAAAAAVAATPPELVQLRYASPAAALVTQVHLPLGTHSYYVGNYNLQIQAPASTFQGYCVDPFQYASSSYLTYEKSTLGSFLSGSAQKLADVTSLFSHAYAGTVGNATKAAGFQLALWEVFSDDRNLATGKVYKTGGTNAAVVTEAGSLLASLSTASWTAPAVNYDLTMFSNGQAQDFLVAAPAIGPSMTPVPEPESVSLMLAGLGLLGFVARKRRSPRPAA